MVLSNYVLKFRKGRRISEKVIFPVSRNESRGIEDARFVRFVDDDGEVIYYATYTAYNGFHSLPQFIETTDFLHFKVYTLNGKCAQNKGMALFPRKVQDRFVMISRLDGENIYLLRSDDIHFWNEADKTHGPVNPWEFIQIGNCGSPIETKEGWLLLTHGVGPMREYWMGALLLDLEDPSFAATVAATVDAHYENSRYATRTETERAFQAALVSMYGNVGLLMNAVGIAVFFAILLVAANAMAMSMRERTTEVAVLKAIGFPRMRVLWMVLGEACSVALIGGVMTKIGDLVLDGSVRTQLMSLKESLQRSENI